MGQSQWASSLREPCSVSEALALEGWRDAMETEMAALHRNHTWTLVPPSPTYNLVGNRWVFATKLNADGSLQRLKARLVAKGFHQRPGVDYSETFSPVVKASTVRIVLTLAVAKNWPIRQLDINNAFLNGQLEDDVFMVQPEGFIDQEKPDYVCKLNRSLYGLKQAPRAWFEKLKQTLQQWGFKNSRADNSLFYLYHNEVIMLVLIYVDDIIVTGNNNTRLTQFVAALNKKFTLKDLGPLSYFLGIEACRDETGLYLTQSKYIEELLHRYNMTTLKPCPTPIVAGKSISLADGEALQNPSTYRSLIGALQYLCHTRPDIAFAVNKLSQFLQKPTSVHWSCAKRILRYLKGTVQYGLHISPSDRLQITGYSDADWACCPDDRRSVAGYCVYLGDSLISWS